MVSRSRAKLLPKWNDCLASDSVMAAFRIYSDMFDDIWSRLWTMVAVVSCHGVYWKGPLMSLTWFCRWAANIFVIASSSL